jgi:hypothetical protein
MMEIKGGGERPKSRRGGRRPGAGRKRKGQQAASAIAGLDLKSALESAPPQEIETVAQRHAHAALEALVKQLIHGASEPTKVQAANAILDRGYGKPSVDVGGDPLLPFFGSAPIKQVATEIREEARKYAHLAIAVLEKIASNGESESARVTAAKALWDRGLGTVAPAKVPDEFRRVIGKKEEAKTAARGAATGRYATPEPPKNTLQ